MIQGRTFTEKVIGYAVIVLFALAFFGGFHIAVPARAATIRPAEVSIPLSPELSNEEVLFARAAQFGSVRVIVGFDIGFQSEGSLLLRAQIEKQRMAIEFAQDAVLNSLESHDVRNVKRFGYIPYMAMEVDEAALDALWMNPDIVSIHEDMPLPPLLDESVPRIGADGVWNVDGFDGTGIAVAVLDTGVRKGHEFLDDGKVVSEACYSTTSSSSGSITVCPNGKQQQVGSGAGENCSLNWDGCDHGTHVAGIAAGSGSSLGFDGVAKGADIISIQVFSKFTGSNWCGPSSPCVLSYQSDQIKALERVYELRNKFNIAAVNLSLGAGKATSPCDGKQWAKEYKDIIVMLRDAGIATVIASGNDGYSNALSFPACISSSVSVGATTVPPFEGVASFSNHAAFLDLLAPGVGVLSSVPDTTTSYKEFQGTSMAAPHVAGAFALLRQANFDASVNQINKALKNNPGASFSKAGKLKPRIDVAKALADLGQARPQIISPVPGAEIDTGSVEFEWEENGAAVQKWDLWVGTTPGGRDVFDGDTLSAAVTFQSVDCIPLTGEPLYVRLRFKIDGNWWFIDFQYATATSTEPPEITVPSPGATLSDNQATFSWDAGSLCVDAWRLYVGTSQGANDLYDSGKLPAAATSHSVKGLPFDGSNIQVRLRYRAGGSWHYIDASYTAVTWNIGITDVDPATGMQLEDRTVAFTWSAGGAAAAAVVTKWRLFVGSGKGKKDYFDSGALSSGTLTQTVTKLPYNGRTIHVRLKFKIHGIWEYADYRYTAVDTLPKITSPPLGSTLTGHNVNFQWTPESHAVQKWKLYVGSAKGKDDYYNSGALDKAILNVACDVVPTDGNTVYVRLKYRKNDKWKYRDYQYIAANKVPAITSPPGGSELQNRSQEFVWHHNEAYIRNYKLWVGTSQGDKDIYDSTSLPGATTSHTATGLPFDGSTIYVRLKYKSGIKWKFVDDQYTVKDTAPYITIPAPDSTLTHSTVTFNWQSGGAVVERYRVYVGKKLGENNKYDSGTLSGATLSCTARELPIDGKKLYVRLRYKVDGVWYYRDYEYTAVTWDFEITDPAPNSKLPGPSETFYWTDNATPVDQWKLKVGTSPGSSNIHNSGPLSEAITSRYVTGLPINGKKIYVRLQADIDGDVHHKDYWYRAKDLSSYHRLYNEVFCLLDLSTPSVTISACGKSIKASYQKWSDCKSIQSSYCVGTIKINSGFCKRTVPYYGPVNPGSVYSYKVWLDDYKLKLKIYEKFGNCGTDKPFSESRLSADSDDLGTIIRTIEIPLEGDFKSIE